MLETDTPASRPSALTGWRRETRSVNPARVSPPRLILDRKPDELATRAFLLAHDTDPFNQWEAGRDAGLSEVIAAMIAEGHVGPYADWLDGLARHPDVQ